MASAAAIESALPTQSMTTSAPAVTCPALRSEWVARRTVRSNWAEGTARSAPSSTASERWWAYRAPTSSVLGA